MHYAVAFQRYWTIKRIFLMNDVLLLFSSGRDLLTSSLESSMPNKDKLPTTKCSVMVRELIIVKLHFRSVVAL